MVVSAIRVREFLDAHGRSPYAEWFAGLNPTAAAKVASAVYRLEAGNFSNVEGVGGGVFERKIDFGPGYRIYFGKDSETLVILLGGSTKVRQRAAIAISRDRWAEYKKRRGMRS